jgi:hypothetical protein
MPGSLAQLISRTALVFVLGLAIVIVASANNSGANASGPTPTASDTLREAALERAAEEQALLPDTARQVPCTPTRATLPPFTRFSNMTGGFWILSDGRCFTDPTYQRPALSPLSLSTSAADPAVS